MRNGRRDYDCGFQTLRIAAVAIAIAFAMNLTPSARAQSDSKLASDVLQVFREKCASCHSPQAKKVKKFGTITNLPKLAANQKLIKSGDAAHSKLWTTIVEGDMPPDDSPTGPLSAQQKQIIKQWIDARTPTA